MKAKDFFQKRFTQAKVTNEDINKFLDTLSTNELDIPDALDAILEENFLTRERAASDSKIIGKARAEAYDAMDERITQIIPAIKTIDPNLVIDVETEKDTLKKITKLGAALGKASDKFKGSGAQETEKVKEYEKQVSELMEKIKGINSERETEKASLMTQFESEKKDLHLNYVIRDKVNAIEFADEHKPLRETLTRLIVEDVKKDNILSLNESGQVVVSYLENGVPKPKFNGNSPVTFESVLEEKAKTYVKKNNGGNGGNGGGNPPRQEPPRQQPPSGSGKPTLREMQAQAAAGQ